MNIPIRTTSLLLLGLISALLLLHTAAQDKACLAGKTVVFLGDSNLWFGGEDCTDERGWSRWFCEETRPDAVRSFARSGATWSHNAQTLPDTIEVTELITDYNVIYNQATRLIGTVERGEFPCPDIIIIAAGTNDAWFQKKRPHVLEISPEEAFATPWETLRDKPLADILGLATAVRLNCKRLQAAYPSAQLVLITPLQSTAVRLKDIHRAGDIIEMCADRLRLPCIRMDYDTPIESAREKAVKTYTTDGTHTNPRGAQALGHFVAENFKALFD